MIIIKPYKCAICASEPAWIMNAHSFIPVCNKHQEFHDCFQIEVVKRQLNIIEEFSDEFKKCEICKIELNDGEYTTIDERDMTRTCIEHRVVKHWVQLDLSIKWFEYKKERPEIKEYSQSDWVDFCKWRKCKYKLNNK